MQMQDPQQPRRPNPRRRERSRMQTIKEVYFPTIILGLTVVFILIFIVGGAIRRNGVPGQSADTTTSTAATSDPNQAALLAQEARDLLAGAAILAQDYDYTGAMALLSSFSGEIGEHLELSSAYNSYKAADEAMVSWSASQVTNLSFHLLIADPERAFTDKELGSSYQRNFITTSEFIAILNQLYNNGYILVDLDQLYTLEYNSSLGREVYKEADLRLPEGKTPVMITQVNVSYYNYMVDSNNDGQPDAKGDGFAYRLCYDSTRGFYNEMVQSDGTTVQGNYDMVPILENFIKEHAGFSYRGARATVAFTGSDGILGYRVNSSRLTAAEQQQEADSAKAVAEALQEHGYNLACYTYNNADYNTLSATQIQSDLQKWTDTVASVIGQLDILVYARDSDIGGADVYSGSKFTLLHNSGFRYFMGVSESPWNQVNDLYVRHNRLMITGDNLQNHPELFAGMFDPAAVMDIYRIAG